MKKKIVVFLFDGYADWEIAYLTPEIYKSNSFDLVFFSEHDQLLTSMGGLQVKPMISLKNLDPDDIDMLILPGGTAWEKGGNSAIDDLTKKVFDNGKPIAAICAATTFLGRLGLLNELKHTSNDLNYLKRIAQEYSGDENYQHTLAVTDENIITANGIAPIEFSREVFKAIKLHDEEHIEQWYQLFKNGIWSE